MGKSLVVFDLDGTLLNTIADLGNAVNHILEVHGLPLHTLPEYKKMAGHGMRNLVKSALPEDKREDAFLDACLSEFLAYYLEHIDDYTRPYPGITDTLGKLSASGVKLAVASNKIQKGTEKLISEFFPGIPFVAVCGNSPEFPLKPDAALVQYIMNKADTGVSAAIMVGDSRTDINTAKNAGISSIAVFWGFRPVEDLCEADHIINGPEDLLGLI